MATSKPAPSEVQISKAPQIIDESNKPEFEQAVRRRVAEQAYQLYESSGQEHGNHDTHWLQAENEVLRRGLETRESGSWLSINAYLPDVSAEDVQVYLEPSRIIVRAEKRESIGDSNSEEQGSIRRDIYLVEDLNAEIDPSTASAAFKDQKLTLMVKKSSPGASSSSSSDSSTARG